jgi:hypothetical protein
VQFSRRLIPLASLLLAVSVVGGGALYAQLEGADRGVPPIDSASTLEVTGVDVDVSAKTSEEARYQGWREAQAKGWKALWAKTTGQPIGQAPGLSDGVLNSIVSGIIIEQEQIGPRLYIARPRRPVRPRPAASCSGSGRSPAAARRRCLPRSVPHRRLPDFESATNGKRPGHASAPR